MNTGSDASEKRRFDLQREDGRHAREVVETTRCLSKKTVLGRYKISDGNWHRRFGKTRLMPLIHVSWKIKTDTNPLRQQSPRINRKQFDFFGSRQNLGGFLFLLFGLLDRIAHVAGVLAVEGFFRTGKDGSIPKMNKLGTQAWSTLKNKTKKKKQTKKTGR